MSLTSALVRTLSCAQYRKSTTSLPLPLCSQGNQSLRENRPCHLINAPLNCTQRSPVFRGKAGFGGLATGTAEGPGERPIPSSRARGVGSLRDLSGPPHALTLAAPARRGNAAEGAGASHTKQHAPARGDRRRPVRTPHGTSIAHGAISGAGLAGHSDLSSPVTLHRGQPARGGALRGSRSSSPSPARLALQSRATRRAPPSLLPGSPTESDQAQEASLLRHPKCPRLQLTGFK